MLSEASRVRGVKALTLPYADTTEKRDVVDTEEELFMWALARAHGLDFTLGRVFLTGLTAADKPRDYYLFERDKLAPYLKSEPTAAIGVMFSHCSRDADPNGESSHSVPATAWAESLQDQCVPYRAVTEETLDTGIPKQIHTLILPNVYALSDKHLDVIERFAAGGGTIVASFLPAVCDENGEARLKDRSERLEKLLGIRLRSADLGAPAPPVTRADFEPRSAKQADVPVEFYDHRFGKGRVVYLPSLAESAAFQDYANEGKPYTDSRDHGVSKALVNLALNMTPDQPVRIVRSDESKHILTMARSWEGGLLIWMVNAAGADAASGSAVPSPSRVVWTEPVDITLTFTKRPRSVKIISPDAEDNQTLSSPGVSITLRSPRRCSVAIIEF